MIFYKPLPLIRAISFDLDDTLYNNMPFIHEAERCLTEYIQSKYPETSALSRSDWKKIRTSVLLSRPELSNDMGLLRKNVLTQAFLIVGLRDKQLENAVIDCFDYFYFKRSDFKVDDGVIKILKKLSKRVPLLAITNGNVDCEAIGIAPFFTYILHASVDMPMKPAMDMFNKASDHLNIPSKNILHVGDHLDKDVLGATRAGYQSAWLAVNRDMSLMKERALVLPNVQLAALSELKQLVK